MYAQLYSRITHSAYFHAALLENSNGYECEAHPWPLGFVPVQP